MLLRDALMVLFAVTFSIFFWSQEGSLSFQSGFVANADGIVGNGDMYESLGPKPIVIALLDGSRALLQAKGARLFIYGTSSVQANVENFFLPLQPTLARTFGAKIVGLGAGPIAPPPPFDDGFGTNTTAEPSETTRLQNVMIVVLDEKYRLTVIPLPGTWAELEQIGAAERAEAEAKEGGRRTLTNLLPPLWERLIVPAAFQDATLKTASITVMWERVFEDDVGMIILATKILDSDGSPSRLFAAFHGADGKDRWRYLSDSGNAMDDVLHEVNTEEQHSVSEQKGDGKQKSYQDDSRDYLSMPQFSFDELEHQKENMMGVGTVGGVHFQRSTHKTRSSRMFEQPWTTYRESVIAALPHFYRHPWDEKLVPHVLFPSRAKRNVGEDLKSRHPSRAAQRKRHHRNASFSTLAPYSSERRQMTLRSQNRVFHMDEKEYGALGDALYRKLEETKEKVSLPPHNHYGEGHIRGLRRAQQEYRLEHPPNGLVFHSEEGIEVLHLYSGHTLASVTPLASDTFYDDINDDFQVESVSSRIALTTRTFGTLGVSTSMECVGLIRTGLPLSQHIVMNTTICDSPGIFGGSNLLQRFMRGDHRDRAISQAINKLELLGSYNSMTQSSFAVSPIVVQIQYSRGIGLVEVERRAVFMMDSGLVTCLDPSRLRVAWRTAARTDFTHSDDRYPHLLPYAVSQSNREDDTEFVGGGLRRFDSTQPYVIALGDSAMAVLQSKDGMVMQYVFLPHAPVGPAIVADFNGDGVNDLLLVTAHGVYGFVGVVQLSSSSVAGLLAGMMGVLLLLFVTRKVNLVNTFAKPRPATAGGETEDFFTNPPDFDPDDDERIDEESEGEEGNA